MTGNEIRQKFLKYFQDNGHTVVESSSLVPKDDPTLLFTNAGMVQFKTVFMGEDKRDYIKAATCQRCVRAGGKHNDLENVGYTARHHTFFEMLGNFSFGDYFKEEAIRFGWEFLVHELGLPAEKMWISIFEDDDEAFEIWKSVEGVPENRIVRLGEKENFWAMGDTGPCGPCSEIHIDLGVENGCGGAECAVGCDCDRFLELWNLVFMQFNRSEDGTMTPLPKPSIDTGMGLERIAAVMQGKFNNYDSDLFVPIMATLEKLSGRKYGDNPGDNTAMRVIADHVRATAFLVADGVLPSNEGRGYVLRRIMRRAIRYGRNLGLTKPFMAEVTDVVVSSMSDAYSHLADAGRLLEKVVINEETRFLETLEHGLTMLDEEIDRICGTEKKCIDGRFIFKLYDTYGFPVDIVKDISRERSVAFDEPGFDEAMAIQRQQSRASRKGEGVKLLSKGVKSLMEEGKSTDFMGYDTLNDEVKVEELMDAEGNPVDELQSGSAGQVFVVKTPFYSESGGQVGDTGVIEWPGGYGVVKDTRAEGENVVLHQVTVVDGALAVGQEVRLMVDADIRRQIAAHHTATHLLQAALKDVLGDHVKQAGSLVGPSRLRFDFTHFSQLTQEEICRIEDQVNQRIMLDIDVTTRILAKEEAVAEGATALFGEKYDDTVRVVSVDDYSKELCGGTHVGRTGQIGPFTIVSESGIAAGVRRIEALAGVAALEQIRQTVTRETELSELLNVPARELPTKVQALVANQKKLEKQVADLSAQLAGSDLDNIFNQSVAVRDVKVIAAEIVLDSPKTLREVGDKVRDSMGSGVAVLGGVIKNKAALLAIVSKDLTGRITAGDLVNKVSAVVGGRGGGRPDMAQAGGPMTDKLPEAISMTTKCVDELLDQ